MILQLVALWGTAAAVAAAFVGRAWNQGRRGKLDAYDDLWTKISLTALVAAMLTLPVVLGITQRAVVAALPVSPRPGVPALTLPTQ